MVNNNKQCLFTQKRLKMDRESKSIIDRLRDMREAKTIVR